MPLSEELNEAAYVTVHKFILTLVLFASLLGCTEGEEFSSSTFLLPWGPRAGDAYSLKEIKIKTLKNPYEVTGSAADVYANTYISTRGFVGDKAHPRVTKAGNLWVPQDIESSMSLVAYAHMERLREFDRSLGMEANLSWPRHVGIQIEMTDRRGQQESNNAIYVGELDLMAFFPTTINRLPLTVNGGVLAHEHFHAHFQKFGLRRSFRGLSRKEAIFNETVILRGWNEGLADFYAYVYTGEPEFMTVSLPGQALRNLNVEPVALRPTESLFSGFEVGFKNPPQVLGCLSYPLGTQIAVLLYNMSKAGQSGDLISDEKSMLKYVMNGLKQMRPALLAASGQLKSELVLQQVFKNRSDLNAEQNLLLTNSIEPLTDQTSWREAYRCLR